MTNNILGIFIKSNINGKELDRINGLNTYDFGAMQFEPNALIWTIRDPMAEKYYSLSPYIYCGNNPIRYVDPNGMSISPIYNELGNLLGTDDEGLQGVPLFMSENNFEQGMLHQTALKNNKGVDYLINDHSITRFIHSFTSLPQRPDYDGVLTLSEANKWYMNGNGKPLYIDQSQIDLSPIKISDLPLGKNVPINFASPQHANFKTGLIYGTLLLKNIDNVNINIGYNGIVDNYGFEMQRGRIMRNIATAIGAFWSIMSTFQNTGTSYNIYGYKTGKLIKQP